MRAGRALLAAVAFASLAACGGGAAVPSTTPGPTATPARSGIDVTTVAGPTCPVQRAGQNCSRPISARVRVVSRGVVVLTVQTGADGTARIPLPVGTYMLEAVSGDNGLPRAPGPTTVTVGAGQFAEVQLVFDTGIR